MLTPPLAAAATAADHVCSAIHQHSAPTMTLHQGQLRVSTQPGMSCSRLQRQLH
jgi:hypothetical protein